MVTIKYYQDPTVRECEISEHKFLSEFLLKKKFNKEELIDLRFFKGDVLGDEIDTADVEFLNISEGVVTVSPGSKCPSGPALPYLPYIIMAIMAVGSYILAKSMMTDVDGSDSMSSTNKLGTSTNSERIGQRVDDIFGTVTKHTPPLWQVPYRVGVDNQETEIMLLCVGRGTYKINEDLIYDGDTKYKNIPSAAIEVYDPGTHPITDTYTEDRSATNTPSHQIGSDIKYPIGIYTESNDLNASELLPPNDLVIDETAIWTASSNGSQVVLTLTNYEDMDVELDEYFLVNSDLYLIDAYAAVKGSSITTFYYTQVDYQTGNTSDETKNINHYSLVDLIGEYEITAVTESTVTIDAAVAVFSTSYLATTYYTAENVSGTALFNTISPLSEHTYYTDSSKDSQYLVSTTSEEYLPDVGQVFSNTVGPITITENVDKLLINLSSASGFYKLKGSSERTISAEVEITIIETDEYDVPTGNEASQTVDYDTNSSNTTYSVYQTYTIDMPYSYGRVYCRRLTDRDDDDSISNVDKIQWTALHTYEAISSTHDFGDVTLMYCLVPSNSQSRLVKNRETNLTITRKITQYIGDGVFGDTEDYATDQFDQILIHMALDPKIGRLTIDQIDADGLMDLRDEMYEYYGAYDMCKFGYDFDAYDLSFEDAFVTVCDVVNCKPYISNGTYSAFFEKKQNESTMMITHRNKIKNSETTETTFYRKYDSVQLSYRDNDDEGTTNTIYIPTDETGDSPLTISYSGCTTEVQAYRRALREYYKILYDNTMVQFDVDEFGRMIVPGQRIDSPDNTRFTSRTDTENGYRVFDGYIVEVDGLVVELSQPVEFTDNEDHYITFTTKEGYNSEAILCTEGDDEYSVVLATTPSETLYDGYQRDKTKFIFCSEQLRESVALIPQTIEFSMSDGVETNTISSILYDERYYQGDQETV